MVVCLLYCKVQLIVSAKEDFWTVGPVGWRKLGLGGEPPMVKLVENL